MKKHIVYDIAMLRQTVCGKIISKSINSVFTNDYLNLEDKNQICSKCRAIIDGDTIDDDKEW